VARSGGPGFSGGRSGKARRVSYAFDVVETVPDAIYRIVDEQVELVVSTLGQVGDVGLAAAAHDCRKRGKKLRGLLRLVRPVLGKAYGPASTSFRDAGRELSALRDAQAALATFDALVAASPDLLPDGGLGPVRAGLAGLAEEATHAEDLRLRAASATDLFQVGCQRVKRAKIERRGWAAVGPGLERTYRAGRRALAGARRDPEPTVLHEWRKRTKDAWYQVRLLRDAGPSVLRPLDDRFHTLSDALGDAHDLLVICDQLLASPDRFGGQAQVRAACALADERRVTLERRAMSLGARLYAEKPRAYADRMGGYWRLWHGMGDEKPAGGLADLFPATDELETLELDQLRDRVGEVGLPARLYPTKAELIGELRAIGAR
jgi:CHAD domain-containing protein